MVFASKTCRKAQTMFFYSQCPRCTNCEITRSRRRNVLETILSWVALRPYRCLACNHRFFSFIARHTAEH
jgi:hypothetical protein